MTPITRRLPLTQRGTMPVDPDEFLGCANDQEPLLRKPSLRPKEQKYSIFQLAQMCGLRYENGLIYSD